MTQKQISDNILKRFAELQAVTGYKLDYEWVKNHFKRKCKESEFSLIGAAIEDLVRDGVVGISYDDDITTLMLTRTGFENIYQVDAEKTIKKIAKEIMFLFRNQKSLPNHVLILTWVEQMLGHNFNPAELELLPETLDRMAKTGHIIKEDKNNFCITLTQQGYIGIQPLNLKKAS